VRLAVPREPGPRRAVVDGACVLPGRGAYLCRGSSPVTPNADCLQLALRRGGIPRTLRHAVEVDLGDRSYQPSNS
jgi:predicted RNA-binding protein YlxR (DUF448 family)